MSSNENDYCVHHDILRDFFSQKGEVFLNSVFHGGAYTFLLNRKSLSPLMIIDIRKYDSSFTATIYINEIEYTFSIFSLSRFIQEHDVYQININHLIWSQDLTGIINEIILLIRDNALNLTVYIHDYYSVCPSTMLLDYKMEYCDVPSIDTCNKCLSQYCSSEKAFSFSKHEMCMSESIHAGSIYNWRILWESLFDSAVTIIFPSRVAAVIWLKAFPRFSKKILILSHDLTYISRVQKHNHVKLDPFYQIFVLGNIDEHKGRQIIHGLLQLIKREKLNICINVLGNYADTIFQNTPYLNLHGTYHHCDLPDILNSKDIHCFLMPSIWPETFSYTTHEMMATGLPIIAFDIGAQGKFVSDYSEGTVVDNISADALFCSVRKKYNNYLRVLYPVLSMELASDISVEVNRIVSENINLQYLIKEDKLEQDIALRIAKDELNNARNELFVKLNELQGIYNSNSWRMTKPLRSIIRFMKKV
ncbi:MAG: glycosyltransferase [Burkholderiales bacterium]|nr:glycosyltransferase [Burkholderiales bacterium]